MAKSVILRTYGGMGNQLFQILYGRSLSKKYNLKLKEIHIIRYPYLIQKIRRSKLIKCSGKPGFFEEIFSNLRIPVLLTRYLNRESVHIKLFGNIYVDSYLQEKKHFLIFEEEIIREVLKEFIFELNLNKKKHESLVHLRLTDFFENKEDAINHALRRLKQCKEKSDIISDDIKVLENIKIANILNKYNHKVVDTSNMTADKIVQFISSYKNVETNNSTLAFWAALLSKSKIKITNANTNKKLLNLYNYFYKILWGK